ncbi:pyruvate dehydrogenase (acetyl-transferring) kinase, mitochondrial-like [Oscarella lobularis]|uniref:pyruvate dehydrogenase (acetyl-transferring) kinase, mitochondrial-like n=1 Tax=Oscarella lobularis TaxID=121494 RepID=UPI0033136E0F
MKEIDLLPSTLLSTPSMKLVRQCYVQSFRDVIRFRGAKRDDEAAAERFTSVIGAVKERHADAVETVAQGLVEMKEMRDGEKILDERRAEIQYFLDRFYASRISIRMLLSQHLVLFGNECSYPDHIGVIDPRCDTSEIIYQAGESARILCEHYYMNCPGVEILGDTALVIPYVPSHLYHILFELFKNSFRAVAESRGKLTTMSMPPVKVFVAKGNEDIAIKIVDEGGGVPRSNLDNLFQYSYTTASQEPDFSGRPFMAPLAGYGYGLPLARLYARYFNGDLVLTSVEGHGTDVIVYLKALSEEAIEVLPIYNSSLTKYYERKHAPANWSNYGKSIQRRQSR